MDTADRFINNKAPKRIILAFLILCVFLLAAGFLFSEKLAENITGIQLKYVIAAAGGDTGFINIPDENALAAGEAVTGQYGITSGVSPRIFESYNRVRNMIFVPVAIASFLICTVGAVISLSSLFRIYRDMDGISDECAVIAENGGAVSGIYGDTFSCVRKVSNGVSSIGMRMNHLVSGLEADKEFLKDFLTDFSHQLKTSLAVIRLNNDMLDSMDNLTEEKAMQLSDEINSSIDDMESLVFSALKLAKLNAGGVIYEKTDGSLSEMTVRALNKVRPLLESKNIEFTACTDEDISFCFDEIWLTEAVSNLIKNSADHSECTEIQVSVYETPGTAVISVSDNGKGIPQSAIPGIFERFGKCSRESGMSSVGVGMSIAEKIVRAHNGEILIFSEEGTGTRFEITLLK